MPGCPVVGFLPHRKLLNELQPTTQEISWNWDHRKMGGMQRKMNKKTLGIRSSVFFTLE